MPKNTDEVLSSATQDIPDHSVDVSPDVTPEDFDMNEWVAGVRPTRRSVRLFPNAHLIARMEDIARDIEAAAEDSNVDDLIDAYEQAKTDFLNGVTFTLEKRSSEWIENFRAELKARLKLKIDQDDSSEKDVMTALLHQLAEQIVTPSGVTPENLRSLYEANEGELNKLIVAMTTVNASLAQSAKVLDLDFSQRRSTSPKRRRSSAR